MPVYERNALRMLFGGGAHVRLPDWEAMRGS